MVRYRGNDYSVPVAYAHHDVHVRGFVHEVIIGCGNEVIARHKRSYASADMIFDPIHFLPLIDVVARTQVVLVIGCSTSDLDT